MATNWPPPFGLPFTFPSQQPQHQAQDAQPDVQGGPSDLYPPPAADAFSGPWNIPGLNLQSYGQNTQQPQYSPSAWPPPPLPTQDAWNQMQAQLPFLIQNGTIPPPPIPGLNFPSAPLPQTPMQNTATSSSFPAPSPHPGLPMHQLIPVTNDNYADVMDSDKEDGELSDGDRISHSPAGHGQAFTEPPRSVPQSMARAEDETLGDQETYNPAHPAAGQMLAPVQHEKKPVEAAMNIPYSTPQLREEAKQFVKLLHNHNIGYHTLAAEGLESAPLRDLYRSLNLPSEPEPVPSLKAALPPSSMNGTSAASYPTLPNANGTKPITSVKTNVAAVPPAKSAPSPVDRKDYIARLQAAKMSKQSAAAKLTPPQRTPPATAVPSGQPLTEDEKKARTTELIRQRLEALKKGSSSPATTPASKPPVPAVGSTLTTFSSPALGSQTSPTIVDAPKPQSVVVSPFASIPGLFMNSPSTPQPFQAPATPGQNFGGASTRLRPQASDFVPATPSILDANQLGSWGKDGTMVLDSSEGEGSEMDLSDDHASKQAVVTPSASNRNEPPHIKNMPAIPDFPSRSASVNPVLSAVSTPGPQTPATQARTEELDKKEKELAAMKLILQKKIKEQRQKQLAAATSSPKPLQATRELPDVTNAAPRLQLMADTMAPVQQTPSKRAAPLPFNDHKDMSRESKRRRRAEIESGLPSLDAEIANNAARMAQLTKEMEELAANDERMKQDKERLVRELEDLGIDTEGMPHAELQAKKDEIEREQEAAIGDYATSFEVPVGTPEHAEDEAVEPTAIGPITAEYHEPSPIAQDLPAQPSQSADAFGRASNSGIPGLHASVAQQPPAAIPFPATRLEDLEPEVESNSQGDPPIMNTAPAEPILLASAHAPTEVTKKTADLLDSATPIDDEEDFYSPKPAVHIPPTDDADATATSSAAAKSLSEEGEVAMSESEEEEYEPEEPHALAEPMVSNLPHHDAAAVESSSASSVTSSSRSSSEDEEDVYEPPDVNETVADTEVIQEATGLITSLPQAEPEDGEMDMSTSSDESDESDSASQSAAQGSTTRELTSETNGLEQSVADDLAPELQAGRTAAPASVAKESAMKTQNDGEPAGFTTYESPLKHFKSYRYHPNFHQEVPGGFLSMTYSHQIDPEKPLCPTEAAGATCNDPHCPGQHFRGMNITGEKLLVQLGTANPGKTPEEKQLWNDGLRGVLKELRQKNTKDPNGIAIEIAKYRRQFLRDDTRVINL